MISRFDHAVLVVRDLAQAVDSYRRLGFEVSAGGRHTGRGTENAIIRFGLDYLELLGIADERELAPDSVLPGFVRAHVGGWTGFVLASDDLDALVERFQASGLAAAGPFAMERLRPDGHQLTWRLLVPEGISWLRPWPYFIQWDQPDDQRLAWESSASHPNGAANVQRVAVGVHDLDRGIDLYARTFGLTMAGRQDARARFTLGQVTLEVVSRPDADEGVFELGISTPRLADARQLIGGNGLDLATSAGRRQLRLPEALTLGAAIVLEELG